MTWGKRLTALLWLCSACVFVAGCVDADDDFPRIAIFDPCGVTADCELLADACFEVEVQRGRRVVVDAMCSLFCDSDFDCPFDGVCLSVQGQEPICYETCFDDLDCPVGFACFDAVGLTADERICLPD